MRKDKRILYIDMDGVIADFDSAIKALCPDIDNYTRIERPGRVRKICALNPGIFHGLEPIPDAIETVKELANTFDVFFLSTPMWGVPSSFEGKRVWIDKHFGELAERKLILTARKDLNLGDYLIDDRTANGAGNFKGELILFGSTGFENWARVKAYLYEREASI
jgi:5'-nucleotidase